MNDAATSRPRAPAVRRSWMPAPAGRIAAVQPRVHLLVLSLLALLPVLLFLPFVNEPLDGDAGVYATIARGMLRGEVPYHDLFDHKQPLTYGWYALSYLLFGEDSSSPRLLILAHLAATTVLVYWCARLLFDSQARGYLAALVFGLAPGLAMATDFGDARFLMLTPLTAGLLAYLLGYRSRQRRWFAISGVLNGLAAVTLVLALLNLLALIAFTAWRGLRRGAPYKGEVACLLAGAAFIFAVTVLPFAASGSLGDLFYGNVAFNLDYAAPPLLSTSRALELLALVFLLAGPFLFAAGGGAWRLLRTEGGAPATLLLLWSLASLLAFISTGRLFDHYVIGLFPALALLSAVALDHLRQGWHRRSLRLWALIGSPFILLSIIFNLQPYLDSLGMGHLATRYPQDAFQRMRLMPEIAERVADGSRSGDSVLFLGREPGPFYFYANRRAASRSILPCVFVNERFRREVLADLQRAKPLYVLDAFQPEAGCARDPAGSALRRFLRRYYQLEGRLHFVDIYRLRWAYPLAARAVGEPGAQ